MKKDLKQNIEDLLDLSIDVYMGPISKVKKAEIIERFLSEVEASEDLESTLTKPDDPKE